jgi:hypothetical protein
MLEERDKRDATPDGPKFKVGDRVRLDTIPVWVGTVTEIICVPTYQVLWDEGGRTDYAADELRPAEPPDA